MTSPSRRNPRTLRATQISMARIATPRRAMRRYERTASPLLLRLLARLWRWLDAVLQPTWRTLKLRRLAGALALSGLASLVLGGLAPTQAQVKGTPQVINGQAFPVNPQLQDRRTTYTNGTLSLGVEWAY